MADINQVTVSGRLTRDPKIGQGKVKYAFYSIAINNEFNGKKKTIFVDISAFGKEADFAEAYLKKGKKVHVTGELDFDQNKRLKITAREQSVKENVLYKNERQNANTLRVNIKNNDEEDDYHPFTDISSDGSFAPVLPNDNEVPW